MVTVDTIPILVGFATYLNSYWKAKDMLLVTSDLV